MKVKSESKVAQSSPTLRDPMDCSLPGSSVHGIFQARVLEWCAIAFFGWKGYYRGILQTAPHSNLVGKRYEPFSQVSKLRLRLSHNHTVSKRQSQESRCT